MDHHTWLLRFASYIYKLATFFLVTPHQNSLPYRQIPGKAYTIFKLYSRQTCSSELSHSSRKGSFPGSLLISSVQGCSKPYESNPGSHPAAQAQTCGHRPTSTSISCFFTCVCGFYLCIFCLWDKVLLVSNLWSPCLSLLSKDTMDMNALHI